jgi:hypothetical protein
VPLSGHICYIAHTAEGLDRLKKRIYTSAFGVQHA